MTKYRRFIVRYTDRGGIHTVCGWGDYNLRYCYRKWCERVGVDVFRVELIGMDALGIEHIVEHNELRTDLYAKVKQAERETFKQMELL